MSVSRLKAEHHADVYSVRTGQAHRTLAGHTAPVTCLQFDELHIVSGSLDKTVRVRILQLITSMISHQANMA